MTGAPVSDVDVQTDNVIDPAATAADDPAAAALARLEDTFGPEGGQAPPADAGRAAPTADDPAAGADAGTDPGDMTYRDAQALRAENQQYRERWSPFERAFGELDEAAQHRLLSRAPDLGEDLTLITDAFADLAPSDRQIIANVVATIQVAPEQAADAFAAIAEELRGGSADGALDRGDDLDDEDADPRYITTDQFEDRLKGFMEQARLDAEERTQVEGIQRELTDLGYDLGSEDLVMQARVEAVLALARRLGGDVSKAHEALSEGITQKAVDEFVEGKTADADRPLPPGAGAPASGERQLETLEDSRGAMDSRLDALFGPPRQRR